MSVGPLCTASNDGVPPYGKHIVMQDGSCRVCGHQILLPPGVIDLGNELPDAQESRQRDFGLVQAPGSRT